MEPWVTGKGGLKGGSAALWPCKATTQQHIAAFVSVWHGTNSLFLLVYTIPKNFRSWGFNPELTKRLTVNVSLHLDFLSRFRHIEAATRTLEPLDQSAPQLSCPTICCCCLPIDYSLYAQLLRTRAAQVITAISPPHVPSITWPSPGPHASSHTCCHAYRLPVPEFQLPDAAQPFIPHALPAVRMRGHLPSTSLPILAL